MWKEFYRNFRFRSLAYASNASPCSIRALARKAHCTKSKAHFQYIRLYPRGKAKSEWNGDQAEMQVQNSKGANLKHRLKVESRRHVIEQLLNSLWTGDTLPFK
jgi:hypothetical protein